MSFTPVLPSEQMPEEFLPFQKPKQHIFGAGGLARPRSDAPSRLEAIVLHDWTYDQIRLLLHAGRLFLPLLFRSDGGLLRNTGGKPAMKRLLTMQMASVLSLELA
ncbi:hypothetical protein [Roseibium sp.]|uniref:hypothetical protein n=1 Tax=Roseibium sp. TaxID=1936156 RepID=UPI003D1110CA